MCSNDAEPTKAEILRTVISDIDAMLDQANQDLYQINQLAQYLKKHKRAGTISDLHYTVDQERLRRTLMECKQILLTLLAQRKRAVALLKEQSI